MLPNLGRTWVPKTQLSLLEILGHRPKAPKQALGISGCRLTAVPSPRSMPCKTQN